MRGIRSKRGLAARGEGAEAGRKSLRSRQIEDGLLARNDNQ